MYERLIKHVTRPVVALVASAVVFSMSLIKSGLSGDSGWVASSGAVITLFGLLLTTRSLLRHESAENAYESANPSIASLPRLGDENGLKKQQEEQNQKLLDFKAARYGFWFLVIGTLVWSYGDRVYSLLQCIT